MDGENTSKRENLLTLLDRKGGISEPIQSVADYVRFVTDVANEWQKEDWNSDSQNEDYALNTASIVGRIWFRGQRTCHRSLRPRLYREATWQLLKREESAPFRTGDDCDTDDPLFEDLFELEHEMRIDFTNYGHLLNELNQAKTPIDWYFLMQHHSVPTRLLDWTTNALAALFFAVEGYGKQLEDRQEASCTASASGGGAQDCVAVWATDAYWLADQLSDDWSAPLLPYSEDAAKYVPPLENLIESERLNDARRLLPKHPMPIEPPAMHPRVAAQEGRFLIFGRPADLLDQKIRLRQSDHCEEEQLRLKQIIFKVQGYDIVMRELARLGVSRRTLFPDLAGLADFVRWKHFHRVNA
jgi:hypothetical protein